MAAAHFGADPDRVIALPGSEIGLRLLPVLGLGRPIQAFSPSYGTHAEVADRQFGNGEMNGVELAGTVLLANPNNPNGVVHDPAYLLDLLHRRRARGGWLVVDEAFADCDPERSLIPLLGAGDQAVVFRSFGKFFGLAGVRLGFAVGPPSIVARLRSLLGDWPVSAQAIAWGSAAYGDTEWIAATRQRLRVAANALDAMLRRHGFDVRGDCPLFRLAEHEDAPAIFDRLARRGILVRPFEGQPRWLRFGLPRDADASARLDGALAEASTPDD